VTRQGAQVVASRVAVRLFWEQVTTRTDRSTGITPGEVTSPDATQELVARASRLLRSRFVPARTGRLRHF
jgi:hypothetical protein